MDTLKNPLKKVEIKNNESTILKKIQEKKISKKIDNETKIEIRNSFKNFVTTRL